MLLFFPSRFRSLSRKKVNRYTFLCAHRERYVQDMRGNMLNNIDTRLQTRRHSEAQIAVLAIKPHVDWDEKACRELYPRKRTNGRRKIEGKAWMRIEDEGTTTCFEIFFCAFLFPRSYLRKSVTAVHSTHTSVCVYMFDFRKKGKLFFLKVYIYISYKE